MAPKRLAIEMAPALHLLHETGGTEMKTEGTRNNPGRIRNAYAGDLPPGPQAGKKEKGQKALVVSVTP